MSILQTSDLRKYYGTEPNITRALDGVNFSVEEGEFVAVVGTSGSGKSTLLHMMGGLDNPTSGSVVVRGKELAKMSKEQLTIFRRRNIGFVFQNYNLVPILNVYENIVLPIELDGNEVDTEYVEQVAEVLGLKERPKELKVKQACSAVGQARLMMIYQKLFAEYNQTAAQILMTKNTMVNNLNRMHARNTFEELLNLDTIPVVNENDSISSYELELLDKFGDNDTLSAVIAALIGADLLILLSDIDGLFTDDPNTNPDAKFIDTVETLDDKLLSMGKGSVSSVGTGGMATKLTAAEIATAAGADMVIANGADFHVIHKILEGRKHGTLFVHNKKEEFYLIDYIEKLI